MNTRRAIGHMRGVADAGDNHVPPKALIEEVVIKVNLAGFNDAKVRAYLAHMV